MNAMQATQRLVQRELGCAPKASWHVDYRDTAWVYVGGLPFDLSENDVLTIFSRFGEPVEIGLIRDKKTGKSRGFAFLKYEDQRSTDLAVDNLTGARVLGRMLRVDHARYKRREKKEDYKFLEGQQQDAYKRGRDGNEWHRSERTRDDRHKDDKHRSDRHSGGTGTTGTGTAGSDPRLNGDGDGDGNECDRPATTAITMR
ncbi:hypothetical protein KEM52_001338 [Ascosphaera acerosa]|nr:hypothetical protein KEM52_001338 [Ascosphaera acerosa]